MSWQLGNCIRPCGASAKLLTSPVLWPLSSDFRHSRLPTAAFRRSRGERARQGAEKKGGQSGPVSRLSPGIAFPPAAAYAGRKDIAPWRRRFAYLPLLPLPPPLLPLPPLLLLDFPDPPPWLPPLSDLPGPPSLPTPPALLPPLFPLPWPPAFPWPPPLRPAAPLMPPAFFVLSSLLTRPRA